MRRVGRPLLPLLICLSVAAAAPAAHAESSPIQLVSKSSQEQAEFASGTALSADGRYLVFEGSLGGRKGVFREELSTGAVVPVVTGSAYVTGDPGADASAPSVSAEGRYVAFTTTTALDPVDDTQPGSSDVYVADMATSPPTYELASARDGSSLGLAYAEPAAGSAASGGVSLSADGREVVFYTRSDSDLGLAVGKTTTPAGQVVVRDLDSRRTTLVSVERDPLTGVMEPGMPVPGGVFLPGKEGASLSADGTTVAWLSTHLPAQVPLLSDERATIERDDEVTEQEYDEPLWRRIADGPEAPTRRIVGGGDPEAPGCPPDGTLADAACRGPFPEMARKANVADLALGWLGLPSIDGLPQLSADGREVALLGDPVTPAANLFLVDMEGGFDRDQAVRQLTYEVPIPVSRPRAHETEVSLDGDIFAASISADGKRIAVTTARQQFPGSPLEIQGSPPAGLGLLEVYLADLRDNSLQRITHGYAGALEPSRVDSDSLIAAQGAGARSPSLDGDGGLLAFSSIASNLVRNDANDASDAFLDDVAEAPLGPPGGSRLTPAPSFAVRKPRWRLTLTAHSLPDGRVRLVAVVPGAGRVRAKVAAALITGRPIRKIDGTRARARHEGPVRLTLVLPRRLRHLAHASAGFFATARVAFTGKGGRPLQGRVEVRFHVHPAKRGKGRSR